MDRKMKAVISVMAGMIAGVLLVWFFCVNCSVQMTLISRIGQVCLLTKIPASFELEYYSPAENKIRVYDENDREVEAEYTVRGDRISLRFLEKLKRDSIYHCTLRRGDQFIGTSVGKNLKNMCTLYFTRMSIRDRYFQERRNETWIAGDNLPDIYEMQNGSIRLKDIRLFLQNGLVSWKEKIRLEEYDHEICVDGRKVEMKDGMADCRGLAAGEHVLRIEVKVEGETLGYEKDILIIK